MANLIYTLVNNDYYAVSGVDDNTVETITIPSEYENLPVKSIAYEAFKNCTKLKKIEISQTIETIMGRAFYNCNSLSHIEIPNSVTTISGDVFYNCVSLISIEVDIGSINYKSIDGNLYKKDGQNLTLIQYALGKNDNIFLIPDNVIRLSSGAFSGSPYLQTIYLPNSITNIEYGVFNNCISLLYLLYNGNSTDWNNITGHNYVNVSKLYFFNEDEPTDFDNKYWHKDNGKLAIWGTMLIPNVEINNNTTKDGYKVMIVPIKINTDYTIYIDSSVPIEICACYYDGINLLNTNIIDSSKVYLKNTNSSFSQPFVYRVNQDSIKEDDGNKIKTDIKVLENQLVMLLQIPEINTSTVVVLEGNYKNINLLPNGELSTEQYFGIPFNQLPIETQNEYFKTLSSLLNIADGQNYAFNDRLIEYLLLNVIDSQDEISQNIKRIQDYITSNKFYNTFNTKYRNNYIKGVWDVNIRKYIYDLVTQKTKNNLIYDVNGFVDKDTESILIKGKEDDLRSKMGVR